MSKSCCCLVVCPVPVSCYSSCPHPLSLVTQNRMFPYKIFQMCDVMMGADEGTHLNINLDPAQFPATSSLTLMGCDWVLHDWLTICVTHQWWWCSVSQPQINAMVILSPVITVVNITQSDHGETGRGVNQSRGVIINYPSLSKSVVREICWLSVLCWLSVMTLVVCCIHYFQMWTEFIQAPYFQHLRSWERLMGEMGKAVPILSQVLAGISLEEPID